MATSEPSKLRAAVSEFIFKIQRIFTWKSQIKALIVWLVFVTGSFFYDFFPLPAFYFSHKKNIFNLYFVKKGWGWTCGLLMLYIPVTLIMRKTTDSKTVGRNMMRLLCLTVVWYATTSAFEYIEHLTGFCEGENEIMSKRSCIHKKSRWIGFDISGHCFLLSFCILILNEEVLNFIALKEKIIALGKDNDNHQLKSSVYVHQDLSRNPMLFHIVDSLSFLMTLLMVLWELMLVLTCLYYHTVYQKLLGIVFGIAAWHFVYNFICKMKHPVSPCEPVYFR